MTSPHHDLYLREMGITRWVLRGGGDPAETDTLHDLDAVLAEEHSPEPHFEKGGGSDNETDSFSTMGWEELETHLKARPVRQGCKQAVFGVGVRDARLLVIGEAPGAEEDRRGEPFVGRAGQLLDRMLAAISHARAPKGDQQGCYIANICKYRPPNNRDPNPEEVAADLPYLLRQIELLKPQLILAVGRVAAHNLLQSEESLGKLRRREHEFSGIPTLVTYHPAYLLRQPRDKAKAWEDLKRARVMLQA